MHHQITKNDRKMTQKHQKTILEPVLSTFKFFRFFRFSIYIYIWVLARLPPPSRIPKMGTGWNNFCATCLGTSNGLICILWQFLGDSWQFSIFSEFWHALTDVQDMTQGPKNASKTSQKVRFCAFTQKSKNHCFLVRILPEVVQLIPMGFLELWPNN